MFLDVNQSGAIDKKDLDLAIQVSISIFYYLVVLSFDRRRNGTVS